MAEETRKFIDQSFIDGYVTTTGLAITKVLPPMPIFGGGGAASREKKKQTVLEKLTAFFNKYYSIIGEWSKMAKPSEEPATYQYEKPEDNDYMMAADVGPK